MSQDVLACFICDSTQQRDDDPSPLTGENLCRGCGEIICGEHYGDAMGGHEPNEHIDPDMEAGKPWA